MLLAALALAPVSDAQRPAEAPGAPAARAGEGMTAAAAAHPAPPASRLADRLTLPTASRLAAARVAEPERLGQLAARNLAGHRPLQVGFPRELPSPRRVVLSSELLSGPLPRPLAGGVVDLVDGERLVWATRVDVEGAFALRLLLGEAELPPDARVWSYPAPATDARRRVAAGSSTMGAGQVRGPVGAAQRGDLGVWSPTVFGESAILEVDLPLASLDAGARVAFELATVVEIFRLDERGVPLADHRVVAASSHCLVDASCKGAGDLLFVDDYRRAVANLIFQVGAGAFTCTGGLLNTTAGPAPYLLTANHCFDTPASAASLNAFWDHTTEFCGGPDPGIQNMVSTSGSTLLATSAFTDFTLVAITAPLPPDRYHLGWTTAELAHGTTLHRIHNPGIDHQHYSRSTVDATGPISCGSVPRPRFLYSQLVEGGQQGGSSGSVVVVDSAGGQVVGQLLGVCGTNNTNACDYVSNRTVDGAFRFTHLATRAWLDPVRAAAFDGVHPLAGFTLSGGQSVARGFTCDPADAGEVAAFTFSGTVSGITSNDSWASDLRLQLAGPSGSSYDVGGADNAIVAWPFQGPASTLDGAYRSSHFAVLTSNGDGTTECEGDWTAVLTNDWGGSGPVTWSDVSITLHRLTTCTLAEDLLLTGGTVAGVALVEACHTITAGPSYTVAASGDLTLRAGRSVALADGFAVVAGGRLVVEVEPTLAPSGSPFAQTAP